MPLALDDSATSQLRRLQLAELEILKEFQRICSEYSLRYYLLGGSALGAVRHRGFIPWDDDIDVGLPRPDFEKFGELCETELDPRYFWQTTATDRLFYNIFGKVRANNTEMLEQGSAHLPIHHGIYIDVFPLDGVPRGCIARMFHKKLLRAWLLTSKKVLTRIDAPPLPFTWRVASLLPRRPFDVICPKMVRHYRYDDADIVVNAAGSWGYDKESVPRTWLEDGAELPFEDIRSICPAKWHEYLSQLYDDYMRYPPEDNRYNRHCVMKITFIDE
ncbi:MAG: LicD family protein [Gaiellaceae bacterium]|jgi:lipopolysaccharide cholinephosphotransferase